MPLALSPLPVLTEGRQCGCPRPALSREGQRVGRRTEHGFWEGPGLAGSSRGLGPSPSSQRRRRQEALRGGALHLRGRPPGRRGNRRRGARAGPPSEGRWCQESRLQGSFPLFLSLELVGTSVEC